MVRYFIFFMLSSLCGLANCLATTLYMTEAPPYSFLRNGVAQGINVRIAEEITARTGIVFVIVVVPSGRHLSMFVQDPDAYSIALIENFSNEDAPQLAVIWQVPVAVIAKKESVIKSYEDLIPLAADKGVGMMRKLNYPVIAHDGRIKRVEINTIENGLRMLQAGRVAAVVASLPGIVDALEKQEGSLHLSTPFVIGHTSFVFRCKPDAQGNSTSRLLAKTIDDMVQDGTMRRIVGSNQ